MTTTIFRLLIPFAAVAQSRSAFLKEESPRWARPSALLLLSASSSADDDDATVRRQDLLQLVSETPRNSATPTHLTRQILSLVEKLEQECPSKEQEVLTKLAGTWELLWTAQDASRQERGWINPLENQAYSNNPNGQGLPVLPQPIQDRLKDLGILTSADLDAASKSPVRSTQSIDLKAGQVRNVVALRLDGFLPSSDSNDQSSKSSRRITLTVTVDFKPNSSDARRIDVKFQACRVVIPPLQVDVTIPLGIFGPTGWLRTGYIDDEMRITRGHKGSVFVLVRPARSPPKQTSSM